MQARTSALVFRSSSVALAAVGLTLFRPAAALAHGDHSGGAGLVHGMMHPITGIDHILAMVAVGLLAAKIGGRAIWALPLAFVSAMAIGGALGMSHIGLPLVEPAILASILVLGCMIAFAVRLPLAASAAIVATLAVFHGYAHGAEAPATASGLAYGVGFILATLALHAAGVGTGLFLGRASREPQIQSLAFRYAGLAIVLAGVGLWMA